MNYVEYRTVKREYEVDADPIDYVDWLEGEEPNKENLIAYIDECGGYEFINEEPIEEGDREFYNHEEFFKKVEDEIKRRNQSA